VLCCRLAARWSPTTLHNSNISHTQCSCACSAAGRQQNGLIHHTRQLTSHTLYMHAVLRIGSRLLPQVDYQLIIELQLQAGRPAQKWASSSKASTARERVMAIQASLKLNVTSGPPAALRACIGQIPFQVRPGTGSWAVMRCCLTLSSGRGWGACDAALHKAGCGKQPLLLLLQMVHPDGLLVCIKFGCSNGLKRKENLSHTLRASVCLSVRGLHVQTKSKVCVLITVCLVSVGFIKKFFLTIALALLLHTRWIGCRPCAHILPKHSLF